MRRNFSGTFLAQDRGNGQWQLSCAAPHEMDVYIQDVGLDAARAFGKAPLVDLGIEWHAERALLTFMSGAKAASVEVTAAILHEPLGNLYERLPLLSIDADARRLWPRVFRLVAV